MSIRISKLITSLQGLLAEHGDCTIGIRYQFAKLNAITGLGSTYSITDIPDSSIKGGERICWIATLPPDEMAKMDALETTVELGEEVH